MLEDGLFVLAEEYGEWADSGRRINLLALDEHGRLVVVELKRDQAAFMDLQALRYAALVAHMTFERAVAAHERWLRARGIDGDARERIIEHLAADDAQPEIESASPRILLAARDFPRELTASVLWLRDQGIDIRCIRLLPYRIDDQLVLDVTQVLPLPEAEDYLVRIRDRTIEAEPRTYPTVEWTAGGVERLVRIVTNPAAVETHVVTVPHPRLGTVIDLLAAEPDCWVPMTAIIERSGETQPQIQGLFARLTRIVRTEFGRNNWLFMVEGRSGESGGARLAHYRVSAEVADWWTAACQEAARRGT